MKLLSSEFLKACARYDIQLVQEYIKQGININIQDKTTGQNALMVIIPPIDERIEYDEYDADEAIKVAKYLIDKGIDINLKDNYGNTALMKTCIECYLRLNPDISNHLINLKIARLLLQYDANPLIKNNKGEMALDVATHKEVKEMISDYIEEYEDDYKRELAGNIDKQLAQVEWDEVSII